MLRRPILSSSPVRFVHLPTLSWPINTPLFFYSVHKLTEWNILTLIFFIKKKNTFIHLLQFCIESTGSPAPWIETLFFVHFEPDNTKERQTLNTESHQLSCLSFLLIYRTNMLSHLVLHFSLLNIISINSLGKITLPISVCRLGGWLAVQLQHNKQLVNVPANVTAVWLGSWCY